MCIYSVVNVLYTGTLLSQYMCTHSVVNVLDNALHLDFSENSRPGEKARSQQRSAHGADQHALKK